MSSSQDQVCASQKRLFLEFTSGVELTVRRLQTDEVYYFGGPLLGIINPSLRCNSEILTNSDGTRVAFAIDPRPLADRSLEASVEEGGEGLFTAADLDHNFRDARNPFDDAETGIENTEDDLVGEMGEGVVSFSFFHPPPQLLLNTTFGTLTTTTKYHISTPPTTQQLLNIAFHTYTPAYLIDHFKMANGEDNWKLHLLAELAFIVLGPVAPEKLQQANAPAQQPADATTQQQADATAPQPSSPESSSGDDESSTQPPPSQGSTAVIQTATPGKFTSKTTLPHNLTYHQRPQDKASSRQPDAPPVSTETRGKAC